MQLNIQNKTLSSSQDIRLDDSWKKHLYAEFEKSYMIQLKSFLKKQKSQKKIIYPSGSNIFNALNLTAFSKVKVVILGQDPYHGPNQAHGLCFSVLKGVPPPPSLVNIFKELQEDVGVQKPKHGELTSWAQQGVLLLNATLTVEQHKAGSHQNQGWEQFTDKIIEVLNSEKENLVFLLWGSFAQKKGAMIDRKKHLVLESPHPSPLSAYRGFLGNKHFSKANTYLKSKGLKPIDWNIC